MGVLKTEEIHGSSIGWAVPVLCGTMPCRCAICCVVWLYALSFSSTPHCLALWLSFGLWLSLGPLCCHLVAGSSFSPHLAVLIVVWGIVVGVGLRGHQWG